MQCVIKTRPHYLAERTSAASSCIPSAHSATLPAIHAAESAPDLVGKIKSSASIDDQSTSVSSSGQPAEKTNKKLTRGRKRTGLLEDWIKSQQPQLCQVSAVQEGPGVNSPAVASRAPHCIKISISILNNFRAMT
jgi:hypothetical protein